jgi:hypothetical protein
MPVQQVQGPKFDSQEPPTRKRLIFRTLPQTEKHIRNNESKLSETNNGLGT